MRLVCLSVLLLSWPCTLLAQTSSDPVQKAIAEGDLYQSKHRYALALDSYRKADRLSNHSSGEAYLKVSLIEQKFGNFPSAMESTNRAFGAAGSNKFLAAAALFQRATLFSDTAAKPGDKKLREAEELLRQALALDPSNGPIRYNLGFVLLKQGRDTDGTAELNTNLASPGVDARYAAEARRMIANPIRAREPFSPDFSFVSFDHQKISNSSLRGRAVLLAFWNTWCCKATLPSLQKLQQEYAGENPSS